MPPSYFSVLLSSQLSEQTVEIRYIRWPLGHAQVYSRNRAALRLSDCLTSVVKLHLDTETCASMCLVNHVPRCCSDAAYRDHHELMI